MTRRLDKEQGEVELIDPVKNTFVSLNGEHLEDPVTTEDIDDVLQRLERSTSGTEADEPLMEQDPSAASADDEVDDDVELNLSAGELDKTSDPVRVYMREMGGVPLLTREKEVAIAKRIERGQKRPRKQSPDLP